MEKQNINITRAGGLGISGLIVLFYNFGSNNNDLYDAILHFLMK